MKKKDYLLYSIIISCIFLSFMCASFLPNKENAYLHIYVENKLYGSYDLNKDQSISINTTNTCVIKNKKVYMQDANCPDQICVHTKAITEKGGSIICLPNKVILEVKNNDHIDTMT